MNKIIFVCLFMLSSQCFAEISVVDDLQHKITLPQPAQRIISLAPHLTEIIYAAGAGDKLVAVVAYSDYPDAAKKLPQVGSYVNINLEAILLHKPDLIIAWDGVGRIISQLQKASTLGIPIYMNKPKHIADIPDTLARISKLAGTETAAQKSITDFKKSYSQLKARYNSQQHISVFYQIWNKPLMTINDQHFISDAIRLCGGRNVFPELPSLAAKISSESVIRANPQVIIAGGMQKVRVNWLQQWRAWQQIDAVKREQLYSIPPDIMQRHSPRILEGVSHLCTIIEQARKAYTNKYK